MIGGIFYARLAQNNAAQAFEILSADQFWTQGAWLKSKIMLGVCPEKQKAHAAFFCFYIIYFALYQTAVWKRRQPARRGFIISACYLKFGFQTNKLSNQ